MELEKYETVSYGSLVVSLKSIVNENKRDSTDIASAYITRDVKNLVINFKPILKED